LTYTSLDRHYRVNAVASAVLTTKATARCVVTITTDAARAFPGQTGYGTSKAALEAITVAPPRTWRREAYGERRRPGPVQTGWTGDDLLAQARGIIPMGRIGKPDDIADAVAYLASCQARWITGQALLSPANTRCDRLRAMAGGGPSVLSVRHPNHPRTSVHPTVRRAPMRFSLQPRGT
jgi:3-oxoacyl-[acyl-carrier protein] reductase